MPAPLAKGIIVSISLLLAAGLAVYEHPQVKQWVDESRRKIAFALHNLGDDLDPPSPHGRNPSQDASTREDNSPEAAERRRRARQEIMERGRMMEERRRSQQTQTTKSRSFDDLVDEGGNLKPEVTQGATSATEPQSEQWGLRNRNNELHQKALHNPFADPFIGGAHLDNGTIYTAAVHASTQRSRSSSTATLPASPAPPPVPPKEPLIPSSSEVAPQTSQPRLLIDTDDVSNHPSEALVDFTPTTSTSSAADLSELHQQSYPSTHSQTNFWSVHEWAENNSTRAQFYTPPRSEAALGEQDEEVEETRSSDEDGRSEIGSGERISRIGSISDMDVMSEVSGIDTQGSWSEVGSRVSEDF
ncbi:MAG: hypothetical protein Q9216_001460 [Gyalolechia sp. 2 TL-2023]